MRLLLAVFSAAILLSGCASTPERDRNIAFGIGIGAGAGALIGSAAAGPTGVWPGAAIGAATGGLIGSLIKNEACYWRNKQGELWQVPCEGTNLKSRGCFIGPDGATRGACRI
jgi:uncharacterized protein YcfJ